MKASFHSVVSICSDSKSSLDGNCDPLWLKLQQVLTDGSNAGICFLCPAALWTQDVPSTQSRPFTVSKVCGHPWDSATRHPVLQKAASQKPGFTCFHPIVNLLVRRALGQVITGQCQAPVLRLISRFQSVVPSPAASASPGNLLKANSWGTSQF